jgi:hypothetical protein
MSQVPVEPPPLPSARENESPLRETVAAPPLRPRRKVSTISVWPAVLLMIATTGALVGVGWRVVRRNLQPQNEPRPQATAEAFADGLVRGDGPARAADGSESTGLRVAYDLLSARMRERVSFEEFYEEWTRRSAEAGFFERSEWASRGFRGADADLRQTFTLSTAPRPGEPGRNYRLRLMLVQDPGGWRVAAYECEPAPGTK